MQGVLETAMREAIPVMEFAYDPTTKEITRGKVNVSLIPPINGTVVPGRRRIR
jgi:hypothetical protein